MCVLCVITGTACYRYFGTRDPKTGGSFGGRGSKTGGGGLKWRSRASSTISLSLRGLNRTDRDFTPRPIRTPDVQPEIELTHRHTSPTRHRPRKQQNNSITKQSRPRPTQPTFDFLRQLRVNIYQTNRKSVKTGTINKIDSSKIPQKIRQNRL